MPKSSSVPQDVLNLQYFKDLLMQARQELGKEESVRDVLNRMINRCTRYPFGMVEWNILRQMYQKIHETADPQVAERVFDQSISQVERIIQRDLRSSAHEDTIYSQGRTVGFVSLSFVFMLFIKFPSLLEAQIAIGLAIVMLIGIVIYNVSGMIYNYRSRLSLWGLNVAMIGAVVALANSIVAIWI